MKARKQPRDKKESRKTAARHPAHGALKGTMHIPPGVDLTEPAEPEWEQIFLEANAW